MNYIVDKNGKELNGKSNHKKRSWISQNMIAALTMIPIAGAMVNFIVKLYIYIYKMGYSSYFQIPNEYLLINYNITIYNMIIVGSISVVYCMCAVNNVRIILRREMLIKKIFWGILLDFLIPVLICFIILSIATGNWEDALIVLQEERRKCIILVLFIIFSNAIIVFAVGYCMVYSFQKDLIEKNRRNKRKEPKKNLSRKHKYRWKNKDYQLIGWLLIIVAIVSYGAYVNWQGIQNAQKQELFLTTRIDNDTYIVVMTDGDEAILEKDRTGKDGKLKICKDKYMKVDCKNRLLEKRNIEGSVGTGNSGFFCVPGGIYAYEHNYNTEKGYTIPKNTTIGKCTDDDSELMYPNTNFLKFFPAEEMPETKGSAYRSGCLRAGPYFVLRKIIAEYRLDEMLGDIIGKNSGLFLDLAVN